MRKMHTLRVFAPVLLAASLPGFAAAQSASPRRTPVVVVVERVSPSVVNISAESIVREVDPFFGGFFGGGAAGAGRAAASRSVPG